MGGNHRGHRCRLSRCKSAVVYNTHSTCDLQTDTLDGKKFNFNYLQKLKTIK